MIFQWLRNRRRAKIARKEFPAGWKDILRSNVWHVQFLSEEQTKRLRLFVQVFVAEKYWEGCDGQQIDDEVKVTIAAHAGLLTLGKYPIWYDHVLSILVYPNEQITKDVDDVGGIMTETAEVRLGEAVWQGPVILSWKDVVAGGRHRARGQNLALHEFAHQLDMANGRLVDGIPPLQTKQELDEWVAVMKDAHEYLRHRCQSGIRTAIDCYGTMNAAEFYSVATEAFFENAAGMKNEYPKAYDLLRNYYSLDPVSWGS